MRDKAMYIRVSNEEKKLFRRLARDYRLGSSSEVIRLAMAYIDEHRPVLARKIVPSSSRQIHREELNRNGEVEL